MADRLPYPRICRVGLSMATWAVIIAALASGAEAEASSASKGRPGRASRGDHQCRCGVNCGTKCCCTPAAETVEPPVTPKRRTTPTPTVIGTVSNPCCVTSAPCGGALPPGTGPLVRLCDSADRTTLMGTEPPASGSLLAPPASDRPEDLNGSRVDEPPERLADA